MGRGKGAPGERVHLDFFSSFFYCSGGGGWRLMFFLPSFDMWKEEGKGMIFF